MPEKLDEEVIDWMCEDCAPRLSTESPLCIHSSVPARTSERLRRLKKSVEASHYRTRLRNKISGSVTKRGVQNREYSRTQVAKGRTILKKKKTKPNLVTKAEAQSSESSPLHQPCSKNHGKDKTLVKHSQSVSDGAGSFNEEAKFVKINASQMTTDEPSNRVEIFCSEIEQPTINTNCR